MTKFEIAWPRKFFQRRRNEGVWLLEATLLERKILDGKPRMQIVCRLATIDEEHVSTDGAVEIREAFWHAAQARLGRLYRLTDRDLDEIETQLAARVPKPMPVQPQPRQVASAASSTE
jgi:hypothetical protein